MNGSRSRVARQGGVCPACGWIHRCQISPFLSLAKGAGVGYSHRMKSSSFSEALQELLLEDDRYTEQAYHFVREGLDFTIKLLAKPTEGPDRHVSGSELLDGIRRYGLQEYGPLTRTVLNRWGITTCRDVGCVVFNMVEKQILGKSDDDQLDDFNECFDFFEAFTAPFLPEFENAAADAGEGEASAGDTCSRSS